MINDFPDWLKRWAGPLYGLVLLWLVIAWLWALTAWPVAMPSTEPASISGSTVDGL